MTTIFRGPEIVCINFCKLMIFGIKNWLRVGLAAICVPGRKRHHCDHSMFFAFGGGRPAGSGVSSWRVIQFSGSKSRESATSRGDRKPASPTRRLRLRRYGYCGGRLKDLMNDLTCRAFFSRGPKDTLAISQPARSTPSFELFGEGSVSHYATIRVRRRISRLVSVVL
jgi:hypothetical protein